VLQCVAVCCSVLQCAAVCCSVLQCAAVCCGMLQCAGCWFCIILHVKLERESERDRKRESEEGSARERVLADFGCPLLLDFHKRVVIY